jgi:hypothetical protein
MSKATLTYTHWKYGETTVEVETSGRPGVVASRARLYQIGTNGDVWNAGRIIDGKARVCNPFRMGQNARLEYAYNDAAIDAEAERHQPICRREESYTVCQGRLIRKVRTRQGKGYEHHCPEKAFKATCNAIDDWNGPFVYEDIQAATGLPNSQVATAIAFLKERGTIVPAAERRHEAATYDTLIDGMAEWCYLEQETA